VAQFSIELILVRQLASGLAVPTVVADAAGTLIFLNEPAEELLGVRLDEMGDLPFEAWTTNFAPSDAHGDVEPERLPLAIALHERRPAHGPLRIIGRDGVARAIEITAFPLEGAHGQLEGGVAMFWEVDPP
jgi:PAS domain S-box-containing protein